MILQCYWLIIFNYIKHLRFNHNYESILQYMAEIKKKYLDNLELYNYIQALDGYIDFLTQKKEVSMISCAALIKSTPTDQAIQIIKSQITGKPVTGVIKGELVVTHREYYCDVCASTNIKYYPHLGKNCEECNPI